MSRSTARGFTLLEVIVALAILSAALMAIFDLNAGAIASHVYAKKVTVATFLARSKMTDVEQRLYDEGLPVTDQDDEGDFSAEGWPNVKWRYRVLVPKTTDVSPEKVMGALFGVPMGADTDVSGMMAMLTGAGGDGAAKTQGAAAGAGGAMMAGLLQTQLAGMIDQLGKSVREVHLSVSWKDGAHTETIDLVTHVVSLGQGGDRNSAGGSVTAGGPLHQGNPGVPGAPGGPCPGMWRHPQTGQIVSATVMINGQCWDAGRTSVLTPVNPYNNPRQGGGGNPTFPGRGGVME